MKRIRVMSLPRYDRQGASSRLRSYQFIPFLAALGIDVDPFPLLSKEYLAGLYQQRKRNLSSIVSSYLHRVQVLFGRAEHDVIWIEKEVFPWIPFLFEGKFLSRRPVIVDYDDAIFHNYDKSKITSVRLMLGTKIDRVMATASLVTVGNSYLASRAKDAGATKIAYLPTVVDISRYAARSRHSTARCSIGWIGTPQTASYLHLVEGALKRVSGLHGARTVLIGSGAIKLGVPAEIHTWFENTEARKIEAIDIGIMPLPDEPWERGKCGYKLIQYMAAGIPVIASPVGVNVDIVKHGVNGFLATSQREWEDALNALVVDPGLRSRMGAAGRAMAEERFSTQAVAPRLARLIRETAGQH